jgi:hypothetical protein
MGTLNLILFFLIIIDLETFRAQVENKIKYSFKMYLNKNIIQEFGQIIGIVENLLMSRV